VITGGPERVGLEQHQVGPLARVHAAHHGGGVQELGRVRRGQLQDPQRRQARPGQLVELLVQGHARHLPGGAARIAAGQHLHAGLVEHLGQVQHHAVDVPERLPGAVREAGGFLRRLRPAPQHQVLAGRVDDLRVRRHLRAAGRLYAGDLVAGDADVLARSTSIQYM
jgi:hypothetical protein